MDSRIADIAARIAALKPRRGKGWEGGPYSDRQLDAIERRLGRPLDPDHRAILATVGGSFTFELGPVLVADSDRDVSVFFGAGDDDHNIVDEWEAYRGQIPATWYPFARDFDGDLYCITDGGAVHHICLDESQWTAEQRPRTAGVAVCDRWRDFVMSLRLQDWAQS